MSSARVGAARGMGGLDPTRIGAAIAVGDRASLEGGA
jgi:hypothetical protein